MNTTSPSKINVVLALHSGPASVAAYPVSVEGISCALHRTPGKSGWSVSALQQGIAFVSNIPTKDAAVGLATQKIQAAGVDVVRAKLAALPLTPLTAPPLVESKPFTVVSVSPDGRVLVLREDGVGYELLATGDVPQRGDSVRLDEPRFYGAPRPLPVTTPAKAKRVLADLAKGLKPDVEGVVDAIKRAAGLTTEETAAVRRALNSRTGQLKAKAPSAFGDEREQLAAAAWQGLQPNGFKLGIVSIFSLRGPARDLYDKLSAKKWPGALDADRAKLEALGVW